MAHHRTGGVAVKPGGVTHVVRITNSPPKRKSAELSLRRCNLMGVLFF